MDTPAVKLSIDTGKHIREWCERQDTETIDQVSQRINGCKSLNELLSLYKEFPQFKKVLLPEYENQKRKLLLANVDANITQPLKPSENGNH
jgi:hypothetical protein